MPQDPFHRSLLAGNRKKFVLQAFTIENQRAGRIDFNKVIDNFALIKSMKKLSRVEVYRHL